MPVVRPVTMVVGERDDMTGRKDRMRGGKGGARARDNQRLRWFPLHGYIARTAVLSCFSRYYYLRRCFGGAWFFARAAGEWLAELGLVLKGQV